MTHDHYALIVTWLTTKGYSPAIDEDNNIYVQSKDPSRSTIFIDYDSSKSLLIVYGLVDRDRSIPDDWCPVIIRNMRSVDCVKILISENVYAVAVEVLANDPVAYLSDAFETLVTYILEAGCLLQSSQAAYLRKYNRMNMTAEHGAEVEETVADQRRAARRKAFRDRRK